MLRTGVAKLDAFLGGALRGGTVTDIYGPSGAGKTQLLHQICALAAGAGARVAYVDTTGHFRPERVLQMCGDAAALDRVTVLRATSVADQAAAPRTVGGASALAVDNVTDLFLYEYPGEDNAFVRNRLFMGHMLDLSRLAVDMRMPVVVTNMVRYGDNSERESMGRAADIYTHIKARLSGRPEYLMECRRPGARSQFPYRMGPPGVRSA